MSSPRVYVVQYIECEDLGTVAEVLAVRTFAGDAIPGTIPANARLIVLGGPMSANAATTVADLAAETRW